MSAKSSVNRHRHHSFQLNHFIRSKKSRNMRTTAMAATAKPYNFPLTVQKGKHTITTVVAMTRWNISCIHRILCTHGTTFHCKRFFLRKKNSRDLLCFVLFFHRFHEFYATKKFQRNKKMNANYNKVYTMHSSQKTKRAQLVMQKCLCEYA